MKRQGASASPKLAYDSARGIPVSGKLRVSSKSQLALFSSFIRKMMKHLNELYCLGVLDRGSQQ